MANALKRFKEKLFAEITELPPVLQQTHLPSLDGLRGISIIIVLVYHVLLYKNNNEQPGFNGMFGVNVFFVISGFIITTLLLKEKLKKKEISLQRFYIRRSLKILPVAYLYLFGIVLLNLYYKFVSPQEILSAALFIKNTKLLPGGWDVATGHFWSLSVEEQFYLIFPFILKKNTNAYLFLLLFLIVFIPVLLHLEDKGVWPFGSRGGNIFLDFFRYITPILTGALCAVLIFKKVIIRKLYPNNLLTNALLLFLAYEIYCGAGFLNGVYYKNFISSVLVACVIVNNIFYSKDLFFKLLNSKVLVTVGLASYSIYIWQQVFTLGRPWAHLFHRADSTVLNLAAVLVVSFCSYYFIERKLGVFKNRFR